MNGNYDYNDNQYTEPDYYTLYTEKKTREASKVFSRCHLALFLYLIIPIAVVLISEIILIGVMGRDSAYKLLETNIYVNWLLSFAPSYFIGFPIFFILTRKMKTLPIRKSKMRASEFFALFLIAEVGMTVGNLIGNIFSSFFGTVMDKEVTNSIDELVTAAPIWLIVLVVVIIGPIFEELIFRKLMMDRFSRYGSGVAIVVTSIAFGLFHGNFYQFFYALAIGLILGYIYSKTRNVIYPIVMHMIINFLGSVATLPVASRIDEYYSMMQNIIDGVEVNMAKFLQSSMIVGSYTIIQYTILGAGIAVLIKYIKNKRFRVNAAFEYQIEKERVARTVLLNPGTILFLSFALVLFVANIAV